MQRLNVARIGDACLPVDVRPPLAQLKALLPQAAASRTWTRRSVGDDGQATDGHLSVAGEG
jgi:hypothetical protein